MAAAATGIWIVHETRELGASAFEDQRSVQVLWYDTSSQKLRPLSINGLRSPKEAVLASGRVYLHGRDKAGEQLLEVSPTEARSLPLPPGKGDLRLGSDGIRLLAFRWIPAARWSKLDGSDDRKMPILAWDGKRWKRRCLLTLDPFEKDFSSIDTGWQNQLVLRSWEEPAKRISIWHPSIQGEKAFSPITSTITGKDSFWNIPIDNAWGFATSGKQAWFSAGRELGSWLFELETDLGLKVLLADGRPRFEADHAATDVDKEALPGEDRLTTGAILHLEDGTLLSLGRGDLLRISKGQITRLLRISGTQQEVGMPNGLDRLIWRWDPSHLVRLPDGCLLAGGCWGGVYRFEQDAQGVWRVSALDEQLGSTLAIPLKKR